MRIVKLSIPPISDKRISDQEIVSVQSVDPQEQKWDNNRMLLQPNTKRNLDYDTSTNLRKQWPARPRVWGINIRVKYYRKRNQVSYRPEDCRKIKINQFNKSQRPNIQYVHNCNRKQYMPIACTPIG